MRKRFLLSLTTVSLISIFAIKLTNSFFSDTETSEDNILTAGKVDLKIDNESYYNGVFNGETSWTPDDLNDHKFFDFTDLKPGDWGEDTISIVVEDNDAWLCADIDITKDDDNDCNEPELQDDPTCTENENLFDGEVGSLVNMVFWVDDGDNVFETNETQNIFADGSISDVLTDASWALSQSGNPNDRIFLQPSLNENGSMVGGNTYYIAKYWCFGDLTQNPVTPGDNDPTVDPGFLCNGESINNAPQTDSLLADISFRAEQARHNDNFRCNPDEEPIHIDTFTVPATSESPTLSNVILESEKQYLIEVSGTYFFRNEGNTSGYLADAEWALRDDAYGTGWTKGDTAPYSLPYNGLDLCFDINVNTDWGDLDETTHTYSVNYLGEGNNLSLFIKDSNYSDNSGELTVNIYELP